MAEGCARQGADVVIWGRSAEKNAAAAERLAVTGVRVRTGVIDVADEAAVAEGVARITDEFGRLDAAIANAGMGIPRRDLFEITAEDFERIEAVNVHGVFFTLREAARHMVGRSQAGEPGGSLVAIASTAAIHGAARNEHYGATKGAVVAMVRAMAVELAAHRIRANTVCPGWVRSELTAGMQEWDRFNEKVISRVPMKGWGDPEDFAGIAAYLASDAAAFHTGDTIVLDGGYTIF
jgi:NAD(P)-dependent dehydrogenase (short-subunit alcohol dehydrogenase family)